VLALTVWLRMQSRISEHDVESTGTPGASQGEGSSALRLWLHIEESVRRSVDGGGGDDWWISRGVWPAQGWGKSQRRPRTAGALSTGGDGVVHGCRQSF
jgi:hypothetical protein